MQWNENTTARNANTKITAFDKETKSNEMKRNQIGNFFWIPTVHVIINNSAPRVNETKPLLACIWLLEETFQAAEGDTGHADYKTPGLDRKLVRYLMGMSGRL